MKDIVKLDLFAGIGGFPKGLADAGITASKQYFSEIDKHASAVYQYNFPNAIPLGSVRDVRSGTIERPDIITFGSPCQDLSMAGKRVGLTGERSSLILEAIRIVAEFRPDIFIWENVKGAFSSNSGADFWEIIKRFANIGGYRLEWQLLNTRWFLPQNRERIYLIGHLTGRSEPKVFPIGENNFRVNEGSTKTPIVRTITAGGHTGGLHSSMTLLRWQNKKGGVVQSDFAPTLKASSGTDIRKRACIQINKSKESGGKQPYQQNRIYDANRASPDLDQAAGRWSIVNKGHGFFEGSETDFCPTIRSNSFEHNSHLKNGSTIRRLTEIECERLQGFPDEWTRYGITDGKKVEISSTQRYKMLGNAVTVKVVEEIGKRLI